MNAETKEQQTALTLPERASVALGSPAHEVKLRELVLASAAILSVTNKDGRAECHTAYMALKNTRVAINNTVEEVTEDAKKFTKAVKTEAQRLIEITAIEEARLQKLRDDYDAAEQARKDALIAAERARIEAIQADIEKIRMLPTTQTNSPSGDLFDVLDCIKALVCTPERFAEFLPNAEQAKAGVIETLQGMFDAAMERERIAAEAEAARLAELARIESERAELAVLRAAAAETARLQAIENERIASEQAAERQRLADQAAAQQAEADRIREQAEANLAAERAAQEELTRKERERLNAEHAERERVAVQVKAQLEAQAAQIAADRQALEDDRARIAQAEANRELQAAQDALNAELEAANQAAAEELAHDDAANSIALTAFYDAPMDDSLTDEEIIELVASTFGMSTLEAIDRLQALDLAAARLAIEVAA
jgi:hypothetical protein